MAKRYQEVKFREAVVPYTSDWGDFYEVNAGFYRTPDMTDVVADAIVAAVSGLQNVAAAPCGTQRGFEPRKLKFIRADGSSITVPVALRGSLIAIATTIRTQFAGLGIPVSCVKLEGEKWTRNIREDILDGTAIPAFVAGVPTSSTGGIQNSYTGLFEYNSDAPFNSQIFTRIKFNTPLADTLPGTAFGAAISVALDNNTPSTLPACPGRQTRDTRRFVVKRGVTQGTEVVMETREIPCVLAEADDIQDAGEAFATLPELLCLLYKGESNDRFHRLLA
jgi:hypothetical protein